MEFTSMVYLICTIMKGSSVSEVIIVQSKSEYEGLQCPMLILTIMIVEMLKYAVCPLD